MKVTANGQKRVSKPARLSVRKRGRYSVGRLDRPISEKALRKAVAEFP